MEDLEIVEYKASHALSIISEGAKEPSLVMSENVKVWAETFVNIKPSVAGIYKGKPVGCGGLAIKWPGVAEAWCLFAKSTAQLPLKVRIDFALIVKALLMRWMDEYKLVRVQAPMRSDFPLGEKFVKTLGFVQESNLMAKYHPDGTSAVLFALVR